MNYLCELRITSYEQPTASPAQLGKTHVLIGLQNPKCKVYSSKLPKKYLT